MTKLLYLPTSKEALTYEEADAYLFGIENYSVNIPCTIQIEEVEEIVKQIKNHHKEVFIGVNKNLHNSDLKVVEDILKQLEKFSIDGIFYYDVACISMKNRLQLKNKFVWAQEHFTTNYATIAYWHNLKADMVLLSGEITLDEIREIKAHTTIPIIVPTFGYLPMFVSERKAITNYKTYFKIDDESKHYYIEKEGKKYPILENALGTTVFSSHILNAYQEYLKFEEDKIDYALLNGLEIEPSIMKEILQIFKNKEKDGEQKIEKLLQQKTDKGFLYKETVYKVKNHA